MQMIDDPPTLFRCCFLLSSYREPRQRRKCWHAASEWKMTFANDFYNVCVREEQNKWNRKDDILKVWNPVSICMYVCMYSCGVGCLNMKDRRENHRITWRNAINVYTSRIYNLFSVSNHPHERDDFREICSKLNEILFSFGRVCRCRLHIMIAFCKKCWKINAYFLTLRKSAGSKEPSTSQSTFKQALRLFLVFVPSFWLLSVWVRHPARYPHLHTLLIQLDFFSSCSKKRSFSLGAFLGLKRTNPIQHVHAQSVKS